MSRFLSLRFVGPVLAAVAAVALLSSFTGAVSVLKGANETSVREVRLVVRDMTFYVEGQSESNPTIFARPGERLRIVLRNTDVGMSHDFVIRSWRVNTRLLKGKGEDAIEFIVPTTRGAHIYSCTPHAEMMSGTLVVN
jgi:plastocyanin